jgi:H+-transporting ATPase
MAKRSKKATTPAKQMGLTSAAVQQRRGIYGYNEVVAAPVRWWGVLLGKLWAPVPWMLEVTIALTLLLARYLDAIIIALLLIFNAVISFVQEQRADATLRLLRQRLAIMARVFRDGQWQPLPARELVPDDVIHVRLGDVLPADMRLTSGALVVDQAPLTGESVPVTKAVGDLAYAGAVNTQGEATGVVVATGSRTYFGKTTELVKIAHAASHLETTILAIVKRLVMIDSGLVGAVLLFAVLIHLSLASALPFALIVLIASVPVALPTTFTLTQALGAQELARKGVLITHLAAIEEAASVDILCTDKTGTITANRLSVSALRAYPPFTEQDLLQAGAQASDPASQDPLDIAILAAAQARGGTDDGTTRLSFTPFDPARKRTEAIIQRGAARLMVVKGAPQVIAELTGAATPASLATDVTAFAAEGSRVLGVAIGPTGALHYAGLLALSDPPRPDSAQLITQLTELGIAVRMVTGDTSATAQAIARQVGIQGQICDAAALHSQSHALADECAVYAGVYPEDKFHLVQALQAQQHIVAMTGDGVNDAPALKQAEVGIAVSTATDVAKSAAGMVLTTPGLLDIVTAFTVSRCTFQRMQTYTLNKIIKTIQVALFLTLAFFTTRQFVITPTLVVLLLFANDFVTMALATDTAQPSAIPDRWHVRRLVRTAVIMAGVLLIESFAILGLAEGVLHQTLAQVHTLVFLMLVFSGQATIYVVRTSKHWWQVAPSRMLVAASLLDGIVVTLLALTGILMAPVSIGMVGVVLTVALCFMLLLDVTKQFFGQEMWGHE